MPHCLGVIKAIKKNRWTNQTAVEHKEQGFIEYGRQSDIKRKVCVGRCQREQENQFSGDWWGEWNSNVIREVFNVYEDRIGLEKCLPRQAGQVQGAPRAGSYQCPPIVEEKKLHFIGMNELRNAAENHPPFNFKMLIINYKIHPDFKLNLLHFIE